MDVKPPALLDRLLDDPPDAKFGEVLETALTARNVHGGYLVSSANLQLSMNRYVAPLGGPMGGSVSLAGADVAKRVLVDGNGPAEHLFVATPFPIDQQLDAFRQAINDLSLGIGIPHRPTPVPG